MVIPSAEATARYHPAAFITSSSPQVPRFIVTTTYTSPRFPMSATAFTCHDTLSAQLDSSISSQGGNAFCYNWVLHPLTPFGRCRLPTQHRICRTLGFQNTNAFVSTQCSCCFHLPDAQLSWEMQPRKSTPPPVQGTWKWKQEARNWNSESRVPNRLCIKKRGVVEHRTFSS